METVVITGSGFDWKSSPKLLVEEDYNVILLSRTPIKIRKLIFDLLDGIPSTGEIDKKLLTKLIILFIWLEKILAKRWTSTRKRK